ncbi:uncharacterized protein LOC107867083 [Capsicum annuum]|uniref:uncharacterized protein LOC107867083 n=1 Tax=Capsicum annuum TaxID=4072 RepID=UPI0007BEF729|nr:uncharacterized protein LOC107867083 [Capsicum annuum]
MKEAKLAVTAAKTTTFESLVSVEDIHITRRWQEYFRGLLNEEGDTSIELGELEHSEENQNLSYCKYFRVEVVREAIRRIRRGRATGLDEILMYFWKFTGGASLGWLTDLFNAIFKSAKMPEALR